MTKRLTAEDVASQLAALAENGETYPGWTTHAAYEHARQVVRDNLIPQWQDEPDGDGGLVWVRFSKEERSRYRWALPFTAWKENGEWWIEDWAEFTMRLNGRQVCPITPRPKD